MVPPPSRVRRALHDNENTDPWFLAPSEAPWEPRKAKGPKVNPTAKVPKATVMGIRLRGLRLRDLRLRDLRLRDLRLRGLRATPKSASQELSQAVHTYTPPLRAQPSRTRRKAR